MTLRSSGGYRPKYQVYRIIQMAKRSLSGSPPDRDMNLGPPSDELDPPEVLPNAAFVSGHTAYDALHLKAGDSNDGPASLLSCVLSLEALLFALFSYEAVYAPARTMESEHISENPELGMKPVPSFVPSSVVSEELLLAVLVLDPFFYQLNEMAVKEAFSSSLLLKEDNSSSGKGKSYDSWVATKAAFAALDLETAIALGIPFVASQTETSLCVYDRLETLRRATNAEPNWAIARMREIWRAAAAKANEFKGEGFFTVNMPLFFAYVCRECKRLEDLWKVASEMRNEKEAREYRAWVSTIRTESTIEGIQKERRLIEDLAARLERRLSGGSMKSDLVKEVTISLGISPAVSLPLGLIQIGRRRGHIRFLNKLVYAAKATGRLQGDMVRLFGADKEKARQATELLELFWQRAKSD